MTLTNGTSADEMHAFQLTEKGEVIKSEFNVMVAMECSGISVKFDEFSDESTVYGLDGYGPDLTDAAIDEIYLILQREYRLKPGYEDFRRYVMSAARRNKFHPIHDYLNALRWDGKARIDTWLRDYAGAPDTLFVRAVASIMLIAAVRRVRDPGCKFDEMVVLESPEGRFKSSALRIMSGEDYFSDEAPITLPTRDVIERLRGKWIIECADLAGLKRADVEHLKAFLSRSVDIASMKYAREVTKFRRQCIIVGTTNDERYLTSVNGNRRVWPVRIHCFNVKALLHDRDQLWAEAAYREQRGESIRLQESLWGDAAIEQKERQESDGWDGVISDWLEADRRDTRRPNRDSNGLYRISISEIFTGVLMRKRGEWTVPEERRMAGCLRRLGWQTGRRSHGKNFWVPPGTNTDKVE